VGFAGAGSHSTHASTAASALAIVIVRIGNHSILPPPATMQWRNLRPSL
jgi:hypothetical protein